MSLRTKIALSFLLCILFAFAPLVYLMNTQVRRVNMDHTRREAVMLVESKAAEIASWLNQRVSEIRIIHEHPACRTMDMEALKPYITDLNAVLREQYGNPAETFAVGGTDGRGWVSNTITIDVSARPYFRRAMETGAEYVISAPVISKSDQRPIFLICYPIRSGGETVGFINGSVNLDKITEVVNGMDVYGGLSWIMDRRGNLYSTADSQFLKGGFDSALLAEMGATLDAQPGGALSVDGGRTLFYASIPLTEDWILCSMVDNSAIYATTDLILRMIFLVCAVMVAVTCVLAVAISRTMTRPLKELRRSMDRVAAGDLDVSFRGRGRDEISDLGRRFNGMVAQLRELLDKVVRAEGQKRMAELKSLEAQINPHFLYNTLDTLQWKALEKENYEVADLVNALSRFFRISLSEGREFITVADEVRHAESYLEIQKVRYQDKIDYAFHVEEGVEQELVPKLLLQPLVENAIYHGVKPTGGRGRITVTVARSDSGVALTVADDGAGMDAEALAALCANLDRRIQTGNYGLYNINERLALWFGGRASLTVESAPGEGTRVTVRLPGEEGKEC